MLENPDRADLVWVEAYLLQLGHDFPITDTKLCGEDWALTIQWTIFYNVY